MNTIKWVKALWLNYYFFLSRNSNQIYQVGFKDRNKLIRFSISQFWFYYFKIECN